jgi:hypothetical protein
MDWNTLIMTLLGGTSIIGLVQAVRYRKENKRLKENEVKLSNIDAQKQEIDPELDGENRQHMGVLAAWAKAVRLGEPLVAGGEEGIHGLTLANAMYLSAWKGQAITLPFDEDEYYDELMKRVATSRRKANVVAQTIDTAGTFAGTK